MRPESRIIFLYCLPLYAIEAENGQVLSDDSRLSPAAAGGGGGAELEDQTLRALAQDALCKVERAAAGMRRAGPFTAARGGGGGGREADGGAGLMAVLKVALPALRAHFDEAARRVGATEDTLDIDPAADGGPDPVLADILITIAAIFERLLSCQACTPPHLAATYACANFATSVALSNPDAFGADE